MHTTLQPIVGWIDSPEFDRHDNGPGHPESPARLTAVRNRLAASGLAARLQTAPPEPVPRELLESVHSDIYVARIESMSGAGGARLDADTVVVPGTYRAALLAAGAVAGAVQRVLAGEWHRAFCSVRPPGHHAMRDIGMGFCIFNSVAVGAAAALQDDAVQRVAIVDWDVHHGNGTQDIFWERGDVLYISWHQDPCYPGTGKASERGAGAGLGKTINLPVPPGAGDPELLAAWRGPIREALDAFAPQILLISAGFDADARDPLAALEVTTAGFAEVSREAVAWADAHCSGRIVSVMEGGYDLEALADDVAAHVEVLLSPVSNT